MGSVKASVSHGIPSGRAHELVATHLCSGLPTSTNVDNYHHQLQLWKRS